VAPENQSLRNLAVIVAVVFAVVLGRLNADFTAVAIAMPANSRARCQGNLMHSSIFQSALPRRSGLAWVGPIPSPYWARRCSQSACRSRFKSFSVQTPARLPRDFATGVSVGEGLCSQIFWIIAIVLFLSSIAGVLDIVLGSCGRRTRSPERSVPSLWERSSMPPARIECSCLA
jgi:hypothetical protein